MSTAAEIQEMKKKRFQFLFRCWELSGGDEHEFLNMNDIGEELGFGGHEIWVIYQYLVGEGLIKGRTIGGGMSITHSGIVQVEAALSEPEAPTDYFPAVVNIVSAEHIVDSPIQQASPAAAQVVLREDKYGEVQKAVHALEEQIDELALGQQDNWDLRADIDTIKVQMSRSAPSGAIVSQCIKSVIRILEGVAGTALGALLLEQFKALLGG